MTRRNFPHTGLGLVLCLGFCVAAGPVAAERAAVVSAVAGEASGTLAKGSAVSDGQPVRTGAAENMALVLEDDALLELCARSVVTLNRHAVRKAQIVKLDAGEARFVVSPRDPDARIEVHTPSAIATILGTVIVVKVDEMSGETTVTSEENQVEVRSNDPAIEGSTRVSPGEQVVIRPGRAPGRARLLPDPIFATLGECLMDLENAALADDRIARRKRDLERIASADSDLATLPNVAGPDFAQVDPHTTFFAADPDDALTPTTEFGRSVSSSGTIAPPPRIDPTPPPCNVAACTPGFP